MPLVHECRREGCTLLTMGEFCVEHEHGAEPSLSDDLAEVVAAMSSPETGGPVSAETP